MLKYSALNEKTITNKSIRGLTKRVKNSKLPLHVEVCTYVYWKRMKYEEKIKLKKKKQN